MTCYRAARPPHSLHSPVGMTFTSVRVFVCNPAYRRSTKDRQHEERVLKARHTYYGRHLSLSPLRYACQSSTMGGWLKSSRAALALPPIHTPLSQRDILYSAAYSMADLSRRETTSFRLSSPKRRKGGEFDVGLMWKLPLGWETRPRLTIWENRLF